MPNKKTIYCNNRSVGRLLPDAKSEVLVEPGREEDGRVFFNEHLDKCRACRDEMIDHANQLALAEIAEENYVAVDTVVERLGEAAKQLRVVAHETGVPFEEVVIGILRGCSSVPPTSKSILAVRSVASTDA